MIRLPTATYEIPCPNSTRSREPRLATKCHHNVAPLPHKRIPLESGAFEFEFKEYFRQHTPHPSYIHPPPLSHFTSKPAAHTAASVHSATAAKPEEAAVVLNGHRRTERTHLNRKKALTKEKSVERIPCRQARISRITRPCTSVRRRLMPLCFTARRVWSIPSICRMVACKS